ncbi:MAG: MMPL family transporter [Gammaproteobacteria bacterium]|nr:MMPL family transporter [Gammaproteobacteria bacterium]
MITYKKNIGISIAFFICILGIVLLLGKASVNQSSTLEQMLSVKDRNDINHYRQLFNIEAEPVIIAIQGPSAITADRITGIEKALQSINDVANTLSSVSMQRFGFNNKQLLSLQDHTELILVMVKPGTQQLETVKQLAAGIRQAVDSLLTANESALIAGQPQIRVASWDITEQDLKTMLPLLLVLTVIITLLFFHSYAALALSLLLTSLTTLLCLGLHLLVRAEINMLLVLAVPVIWAVSTLDVFHIYNRTAIRARKNHSAPATAASRELFVPCLLTTLTTAGCFLTLTVLDTSPLIIMFGLWCAAGAVIAFILTFTLGKKLLTLVSFKKLSARWPGALCLNIVMFSQKHALSILLFWSALVLLSLLYVSQLQVSTSYPQVFTENMNIATEIKQLSNLTDSDLNAVDIIIEPGDSHGESISNITNAVILMRNYLRTIDETRLILPLDLLNQDDMEKIFMQWQADGGVNKTAAGGDVSGLSYWFNEKSHAVRLQVYLARSSHRRKQEIFNWIRHFDETMLSHHKITLAGSGYYYHLTEHRGLNSLVLSSVLSLLILALTMYWITGNGAQVLVALSGSVVPAIILTGGMAVFNIPWSIAMLPLPAVLLGLMNDDTIHIIWSARQSRRFSDHQFRRNALNAGAALLATSLVLSSAVAILILSGIQTNQYLGILIPVGLLLAYFCNLSLIPALSSLLRKSPRLTG